MRSSLRHLIEVHVLRGVMLLVGLMLVSSGPVAAQNRGQMLFESRYASWLERSPAVFYLGHREKLELTSQQVQELRGIERRLRARSDGIAAGIVDSVGRPSRQQERLLLLELRDEVRNAGREAGSILTGAQRAKAEVIRNGSG